MAMLCPQMYESSLEGMSFKVVDVNILMSSLLNSCEILYFLAILELELQ